MKGENFGHQTMADGSAKANTRQCHPQMGDGVRKSFKLGPTGLGSVIPKLWVVPEPTNGCVCFEGLIFLGWSKGTSKGKPPLWTSLLWPVRWYEQGSKDKGQGQRHIPSRWSGDSSPHGKCVYAGRWPCPKSALFYLAFCAGFASLSICVRLSGWFKEKPEVEPPFWGSPCFDTFRMVCEWPLPLPLGD